MWEIKYLKIFRISSEVTSLESYVDKHWKGVSAVYQKAIVFFVDPQYGATKFKACIPQSGKYPAFTVIYVANPQRNICGEFGAQGEIRTLTPVKAGDFETFFLSDFKQ